MLMRFLVCVLFSFQGTACFGAEPKPVALELYLYGEKPGAAQPTRLAPGEVVSLDLARDEFEHVIVRLPESQARLAALKSFGVEESGESTSKALPIELRAYALGSQAFEKSSFRKGASGEVADIVIPNEWAARPDFKIPAANVPKYSIFLFELRAPVGAAPGGYRANLKFSTAAGSYSIPLEVTIHGVTLPKKFALKTSFGFAPYGVLMKHYGKWVSDELDLYRKYFALASDHRVDLHKIYMKFPDSPEGKGAGYDPLRTAARPEQSFLGQWGPLAQGTVGSFGFRWAVTDLPVPDTMKTPSPASEAFWRAMNASVKRHKLEDSTFVYFVDEPTDAALPKLAESVKKIRQWAPDLTYLVTTHYRPGMAQLMDGGFNAWCINLIQWDVKPFPTPEFYLERVRKLKDRLWLYSGCNAHGCSEPDDVMNADLVTDRPSAYHRIFPWMAARYEAEGILYYDTVYNYGKFGTEEPWKDPFAFTGYGEGNLFYPCTPQKCGTSGQEVFPSLRMKILRDGLEDVELMRMARLKGAPVDAWLKETIPNARKFPVTTGKLNAFKKKVLEALASR